MERYLDSHIDLTSTYILKVLVKFMYEKRSVLLIITYAYNIGKYKYLLY